MKLKLNRRDVKHILICFCIAGGFLTFQACKEVGPQINLHGSASIGDSTWVESPVASPQQKNVVIEEFTGTNCTNCPSGHAYIAGYQTEYGTRLVAVAFHPSDGQLGAPAIQPPSSISYDLEDNASTALFNYLVNPSFLPAAGIDRFIFSGPPLGQTTILIDRDYWLQAIQAEMSLSPVLNLNLSTTYDSTNRQLSVNATIHIIDSISDPTNITILLTEDSIVDAQLNGSVIDTFYVHNNNMRTMLTGTTGDNIIYSTSAGITLQAGRVIRLIYPTVINTAWNPHHMHVVAYVHDVSSTNKVVYQGQIIPLIN